MISGYLSRPRGRPKTDLAAEAFYAAAQPAQESKEEDNPPTQHVEKKARGSYMKYDNSVLRELIQANLEGRTAAFDDDADHIAALNVPYSHQIRQEG